eukprot:scaffold310_cov168-Amphora_coffeaeformis.AAC.39
MSGVSIRKYSHDHSHAISRGVSPTSGVTQKMIKGEGGGGEGDNTNPSWQRKKMGFSTCLQKYKAGRSRLASLLETSPSRFFEGDCCLGVKSSVILSNSHGSSSSCSFWADDGDAVMVLGALESGLDSLGETIGVPDRIVMDDDRERTTNP